MAEKRTFSDQPDPAATACPACGGTFRGLVRNLREGAEAAALERGALLLAALFKVKTWADDPPRLDRDVAGKLCEEWNGLCPEGTAVRFYGTWGLWTKYRDSKTRSTAFLSSSNEPVIFLEGVAGYVSLYHVEPLAEEGSHG